MNGGIVFLLGFIPNPRMMRRIAAAQTCAAVSVVCWDRGRGMVPPPNLDGVAYTPIRIPTGDDPLKRLPQYARFFRRAMRVLRAARPSIIYVQGLDMLALASRYRARFDRRTKIVYEVADINRLLTDPQRGMPRKAAQRVLLYADKRLTRRSDLLVVTSQAYADRYFSAFMPAEKILPYPNMPNTDAFSDYIEKPRGDTMTIGFIGAIRYKAQLEMLLEAAKACDMRVLMAGYECGESTLEEKCRALDYVTWHGPYDYAREIASLYGQCDIIYSVYDADMNNVRMALPNRLYEAVYCRIPILAARGTRLGEIVCEWGVGAAVDHRSCAELTRVLQKMRDDREYYASMKAACARHRGDVDDAACREALIRRLQGMPEV